MTNPAEPSGVLSRECDQSEFERRYGPVYQTPLVVGFDRFIKSIEATTATRTPTRNAMLPKPVVR